MACGSLSKGFQVPCILGSAGYKSAGFAVHTGSVPFTSVTGTITGISTGATTGVTAIYKYKTINDGSTFTETGTNGKQTRSSTWAGVCNLVMAQLTVDMRNEILMLAKGEVWIFLEDFNNNIWLVGRDFGATMDTSVATTGGARTDMKGWTLTFNTLENEPMLQLTGSALTTYAAIKVEGV